MVISKLAYGDLARTMEGCNQGNWLLRIGFMCLLKYFWRVWGTMDLGGLEVEMWKNGVPIKTGNSV